MKRKSYLRRSVVSIVTASLLTLTLLTVGGPAAADVSGHSLAATSSDSLYIGDVRDNTVKNFDTSNGQFLGRFVKSGHGLDGPMGLVFSGGSLLVVNQNIGQKKPGDIYRYSSQDGSFQGVLPTYPNQPPAPRGMVVVSGHLFVASPTGVSGVGSGMLQEFDANNGTGLLFKYAPNSATFHPRGVVLGPDGYLYVSNDPTGPTGLGGQVLRFDPNKLATGPVDTAPFIDCPATAKCPSSTYDFNRPEGLVFNPAGDRLYVTSFKNANDSTSNDKILVFDRTSGQLIDKIDLDATGSSSPRSFAQAMVFGPGGFLYVPINNTGEVWRYDVTTKVATPFVAAGTLGQPFYLTFGRTDPATLAYNGP